MAAKPICFVIMGYGLKTDFETGKTIDLDKTYLNIIKPAAENAGFDCVRADEIDESGLIDKSMYALLLRADLVVADISTHNPNAIYELGVRHASRPFSTIILSDRTEKKIPFDIDHTRIFMYEHLGKDIGADEAKRCIEELSKRMITIHEKKAADSPLYEMLPDVKPPILSEDEFQRIIGELAKREKSIFAMREAALDDMANKRFSGAAVKWKKAAELSDQDAYFVQQAALATYKSYEKDGLPALTDALSIIETLTPDSSNDPETLGITGAIYKNLYYLTEDLNSLSRATDYYKRGFAVANDYYTGENYANCLELLLDIEEDEDEKTYLRIEAKRTRRAIVERLQKIEDEDVVSRPDGKWIYATLSNCFLSLGEQKNADLYEERFVSMNPSQWEVDSFGKTKSDIQKRRD